MANGTFDQRFTGLLGNPMFQAGMGLLSGNQGGDPYAGFMSGLASAQQYQTEAQKREQQEQLRRELAAYLTGGNQPAPMQQQVGAPGHTAPPRTVAEAATMRAQAMGEPMPELTQEDYFTPVGNATTRPAGLLDPQPAAASQQAMPELPSSETLAETAQQSNAAGILAETPGDTLGTPRQQMAQTVDQAQAAVPGVLGDQPEAATNIARGGADPMALFGLLAQYGDPQKAAEGFLNYQIAQQRLTAQASQARTRGFSPIIDDQGRVFFPDLNAPGGVTQATDAEGNPLKAPPGIKYQTDAAGNIIALPTRGGPGGAPVPQTVVSATDVEQDLQTRADIEKQGNARRALGGIEDMIAQPGGAWETVNSMLSPEMESARELVSGGSSIIGVPWSYIPGTDAANFRALQEKLSSQAFIDSITQLRQQGGTVGQITEREGAKLENARLRLMNASDDEQFKRELVNFRDSLRRFLESARREAGVDTLAPTVPGGIDFRTQTQRATDDAAVVELPEGGESRVNELRQRYLQGNQ